MSLSHVVGSLIWHLKADPTNLNQNLTQATSTLKKQEKEMGGVLGLLSSKWSIIGGVAAGAAYAMIRASPSLSFAMEEVSYRFEYMLGILGEEFAPLLEEILIPALDTFIPIVENVAPVIGEAVAAIVSLFKSDEAQGYISRITDALGSIAGSIWDVVEPALKFLWNVLEVVGPPLIEGFVSYLEFIADVLGRERGVVWWIEFFVGLISKGVTTAINIVKPIIVGFQMAWDALSEALFKEHGLIWWIQFLVGLMNKGLTTAINWIWDKLQWLGDKFVWLGKRIKDAVLDLKDFIEEAADIAFNPRPPVFMPQSLGSTALGLGSALAGGGAQALGQAVINITIPSVNITGDYDAARLADKISSEIKRELGLRM